MQKNKKPFAVACLLGIAISSAAFTNLWGKEQTVLVSKPEDKGFALVELFTSEGCSSCPPADELVARVQKENPNKPIYILAYHVDYWDHQGWKDTYSDADYTKRQNMYASWLHLQTIYTPQIVLNGKSEFVGSDQHALLRSISAGLQESPVQSLAMTSHISRDQVEVSYQTNGPLKQSDLVIALVQKSGQSKVRAGENSGRTLTHVQIVRKLATEPLRSNSGKISLVLPKDYKDNTWELIGFVQHKTNGVILSAARSELTENKLAAND